jgi:hypothetical protein
VWLPPQFAASIVVTGGKFATGINDTSGASGKFTTSIIDTGGKFLPLVSMTPVVPVANLPPKSLIPLVHLDLRISP